MKISTAKSFKYKFIDRSSGKKKLCMVLAGYKQPIWNDVFARLAACVPEDVDVCVLSSGLFSEELDEVCENYNWSYLSSSKNQLCFIQNMAINLHPNAEWIYKIDEDIFLTQGFFEKLMETYLDVEKNSDYCPSIVAPLININGFCYLRLIEKTNLKEVFLHKFGKAKLTSGIEHDEWIRKDKDFARFMWGKDEEILADIDALTEKFIGEKLSWTICPVRFSIGAILFHRSLWEEMKGFTVKKGNGLGDDEEDICKYAFNTARPIIINENIVAGHLGYGPQTGAMMLYYKQHSDIFADRKQARAKDKIKITIACHKESFIPYSTIYCPIELGSYNKENHIVDFFRDDTGENISHLNYTLSELTAQYWAWKNLDLEIYGACHYRRFFYLGNDHFETNDHAQIEEDVLLESSCQKYQIDNEHLIKEIMSRYDIVAPISWDVRKATTPKGYKSTVQDHMIAYDLVTENDIRSLKELTLKFAPDWEDALDRYLSGYEYIGYNCFVMKKDFFNNLCEKEFGILLMFIERHSFDGIEDRLCGYLGEILFSAYILKCEDVGIKCKRAPLVFFKDATGNTKGLKELYPQKFTRFIPPTRRYMNRKFAEIAESLDELKIDIQEK